MLTTACRKAHSPNPVRKFRSPRRANSGVFIFLLLAFPALAAAQSCPVALGGIGLHTGNNPVCENEAKGTTCKLSCIYDQGSFTRLAMTLRWFKRADPPPNLAYKNWVIDGRCKESTDPTTINHPTKQVWAYLASLKRNGEREAEGPIREMMTMVADKASNCGPDSGSTSGRLKLRDYAPLEHFRAGMGTDIAPAGDIAASLTDAEGRGVAGKLVVFYIDPKMEDLLASAISNEHFYDVLSIVPGRGNNPGSDPQRPVVLKNQPIDRKYLGYDRTDGSGNARVNYLWLIDRGLFVKKLIERRYIDGERFGAIRGTIRAGVVNPASGMIENETSLQVEFRALGKILRISGDGRPDSGPDFGAYPGRVRVKRTLNLPKFDMKPVDKEFLLMPGDIVDIDGNASIEIAWVTGEKVIASVPDEIEFADTRIKPAHASMIMLSSPYESGFLTTRETVSSAIFGFGIKQAIEVLVESIPVIGTAAKKSAEFCVELHEKTGDPNFYEQGIMSRIRVRSKLLIDNTGERTKVYNIAGSPDIKTAAGGNTTLQAGNMVAVSKDGRMGEPQRFDQAAVQASFMNRLGTDETAQKTKTDDKSGKDEKEEKVGVEAKNPDQWVYCNVRFNEKVFRTICEKGDDKGVPIDLYYYETPGVVSVPGVDGGRRLYNRFVRVPSVDHKDQSNVRWLHAYWVFSLGEWRTQGDFDVKVEVLGRVP